MIHGPSLISSINTILPRPLPPTTIPFIDIMNQTYPIEVSRSSTDYGCYIRKPRNETQEGSKNGKCMWCHLLKAFTTDP